MRLVLTNGWLAGAHSLASCGCSNMAFVRKIAHFFGTTGLLSPLATLCFASLSSLNQRTQGQQLSRAFLQRERETPRPASAPVVPSVTCCY